MNILGLSCFYHDAGACLLQDGAVVAAAEEERFSRVKHDAGLPVRAADYCLGAAGLEPEDLDFIIFYEKPLLKFARLLTTAIDTFPRGIVQFSAAMPIWLKEKLWVPAVIQEKLGYRGIDTCELAFDDYRVPAGRLIGGVEGRGLQQILSGLELGRINVAARGVGVADAALTEAVAYSQVRKTFGKPICQHQAIQLKLADMATRVEAARLLTQRAATAYDRGERCDMEAGMAKLAATEAALENSIEAMRIHGGYGYSKEFAVERLYRDAPLLVIGEGTNEMQRIIIARQLIERNRA